MLPALRDFNNYKGITNTFYYIRLGWYSVFHNRDLVM